MKGKRFNESCPACEKGELQAQGTWERYKTSYNYRLTTERPIYGTLYTCDNEECEEKFYNDEEDESLKSGRPC